MIGYELGEPHADGRSMQKEAPRQEGLDRGAARIGGGQEKCAGSSNGASAGCSLQKRRGADKVPALILA
jgi:hypothetical protein